MGLKKRNTLLEVLSMMQRIDDTYMDNGVLNGIMKEDGNEEDSISSDDQDGSNDGTQDQKLTIAKQKKQAREKKIQSAIDSGSGLGTAYDNSMSDISNTSNTPISPSVRTVPVKDIDSSDIVKTYPQIDKDDENNQDGQSNSEQENFVEDFLSEPYADNIGRIQKILTIGGPGMTATAINRYFADFTNDKVENGFTNRHALLFLLYYPKKVIDSSFRDLSKIFVSLERFPLLRTVSYVIMHNSKKTDYIDLEKNFRDEFYGSGVPGKYYELNVPIMVGSSEQNKIIKINPIIDNPFPNKSYDELISDAMALLFKYLEKSHKLVSLPSKRPQLEEETNKTQKANTIAWANGFFNQDKDSGIQFIKRLANYGNNVAYSLFDYVMNIAFAITVDGRNGNPPTQTEFGLYVSYIKRYIDLFNEMLFTAPNASPQIFDIIPLMGIIDENYKAVDFIEEAKKEYGNNNAYSQFFQDADMVIGDEASVYKIDGNDISTSDLSLYDLLKVVFKATKASQQQIFTDLIKSNYQRTGIKVIEEDNNDNVGNRKNNPLTRLIGKKSIDISLYNTDKSGNEIVGNDGIIRRIGIEYQGSQHYIPRELRGINTGDVKSSDKSYRDEIFLTVRSNVANGTEIPSFLKMAAEGENISFQDRMEMLIKEIIQYSNKSHEFNIDTKTGFIEAATSYLTMLSNLGIIDKTLKPANMSMNDKVSLFNKISSTTSVERWLSEIKLYLQQAADKQKFLMLKRTNNIDGKNIQYSMIYVHELDSRINERIILDAGGVRYVSDFANLVEDERFNKLVAESHGLQKINNELANGIENNPAYYTFKYSKSKDLSLMGPACRENVVNNFQNVNNLGDYINLILKKEKEL